MMDNPSQWRVRRVDGPPVVAARVWLAGGSRAEAIPGQALITGRLLAEGTESRDWRRIGEEAEERGCSITTTAGYSVQAVALDGLAVDWERILDWAAELTFGASFPAERCEWLCRQAAAERESLADLPDVITEWAFLDQLYPDHPLGRPLLGTEVGLKSLNSEICRSFHQSCLSHGPLIAVAGTIDADAVSRRLDDLFPSCEGSKSGGDGLRDPGRPRQGRREVPLPPGDQTHLCVGTLTVRRADPDFEAVRILGVVLGAGGGLVGRIPQRIRESEGLAYACDVTSVAGAGLDRGRFAVNVGTSGDQAESALTAIREEFERVRVEGVSETEFQEARAYLLGREPFKRETARQWTLLDLESELWGLPVEDESWCLESVEQVSLEDVRTAASNYLEPDRMVVTVGIPCR